MFDSPGHIIRTAWIIWAVWWVVAATRTNRVKQREPVHEWVLRWVLMIAAFELLFYRGSYLGILNRRFVPDSQAVRELGAVITCIGLAFSIWARQHIGRYWSGSVSIRTDHRLIRTGPYSRIRHPIYTGILFGLAGTLLADGHYAAIVAFLIVLAGLSWKALREENLLKGEFGPAFEEHKRMTGFFLPRLSRPASPSAPNVSAS
ncbi:MAG TPA: isoprenylcysteine carboxylmethyltransferase family protein [Candidatus Acidoferrum sp.]|nr:isoprenylcysteine carboxylmethyltransferase family protein [Candidatus Acidoferrum sp.]